jgi:hypothetical protein
VGSPIRLLWWPGVWLSLIALVILLLVGGLNANSVRYFSY